MPRLAAVLVDAAERSVVLRLAADGELPTIAGLLAAGTLAPTRTPVPYRAEYACTELLTGRSSDECRYWSTVVFDPATYTCATIGSARRRPFYAAAPEGPVVLFDVPHSLLVDGLPGVQVVGWGGHDARFQHPRASSPAGLMDEIDRRFGLDPANAVEYRGGWHQDWYIDDLADALIAGARRRADIAIWLQQRVPDWQLFFMGLTEAHSAGHNFAHGLDPDHLLGNHPTAPLARRRLIEVYRAIDACVGDVLRATPAGTVHAVLSSKGMQPNRDDVAASLLLPELLHRLAFGHPLVHEPAQRSWRRQGRPARWPDPRGRTGARTGQLRAEGHLPRVKRRFHTIAPPAVVEAVRRTRRRSSPDPGRETTNPFAQRTPDGDAPVLFGEVSWSQPMWYRHRWPSMPWFALPSFSDGHVRINVAGRERDGIVAIEDYGRTCDALEATLALAVDPRTGEAIVDDVIRLREDDVLAPDGPGADLVVTFRAPVDALTHPNGGTVGPFAFPRSGSHTENGFLIVSGPGIPHATLDVHPALDVPPTLLRLLGWHVPADLQGAAIGGVVGALTD
jgi:hypothetical protein